jgi:hypothetical protein
MRNVKISFYNLSESEISLRCSKTGTLSTSPSLSLIRYSSLGTEEAGDFHVLACLVESTNA